MKTELKAKFIQQILSKKKDSEGFTLIELLVVIIIIGILSAIALPSFLSQSAKAKQTEGKSFVGTVNRAQQAFRMENQNFTSTPADLQVNIPLTAAGDTSGNFYYVYTLSSPANATSTTFTAVPVNAETSTLRAYAGGVTVLGSGQTAAAACMTTIPASAAPAVTLTTTAASCATNANNMK